MSVNNSDKQQLTEDDCICPKNKDDDECTNVCHADCAYCWSLYDPDMDHYQEWSP